MFLEALAQGENTRQASGMAVLMKAKEILLEPGRWVQGEPPADHDCAQSAIVAAGMMLGREYITAGSAVQYVLRMHQEAAHIPSWNDEPGRTLTEIIALLDEAMTVVGGVAKLYGNAVPKVRYYPAMIGSEPAPVSLFDSDWKPWSTEAEAFPMGGIVMTTVTLPAMSMPG